uniref:Uncharacterized protein n=1 Tax=Glossina pallidipes TaxID=7398 RepID=A0A1A9ZSN8_GLOPL
MAQTYTRASQQFAKHTRVKQYFTLTMPTTLYTNDAKILPICPGLADGQTISNRGGTAKATCEFLTDELLQALKDGGDDDDDDEVGVDALIRKYSNQKQNITCYAISSTLLRIHYSAYKRKMPVVDV